MSAESAPALASIDPLTHAPASHPPILPLPPSTPLTHAPASHQPILPLPPDPMALPLPCTP